MKEFFERLLGKDHSLAAAKRRMRRDWDKRARKNAMHYIADFRPEWEDVDEFFKTGEDDVAKFLSEAQWPPQIMASSSLVEIGCGVGRMTRAFASRFARITAIDVSEEMIARARELNRQLTNVNFIVGDGTTLTGIEDASVDFAMSYIVFQHMPRAELVYQYIQDGLRVLKPGGRFRFQARNDFGANKPDTYDGDSIEIVRIEEIARDCCAAVHSIEGQGEPMCFIELKKAG